MALRLRYCQACGRMASLVTDEQPKPCLGCSGTNFDDRPKRHVLIRGYELSDSDVDFLRTQGIKAEAGY